MLERDKLEELSPRPYLSTLPNYYPLTFP